MPAVWISCGRKSLPFSNSAPALSSAGISISLTMFMASVSCKSFAVRSAASFFRPFSIAYGKSISAFAPVAAGAVFFSPP